MPTRPVVLAASALVSAILLSALAGCAAADDVATGDDAVTSDVSTSALVGSWTVESTETLRLRIPDAPFRTVASIILRKDGSYAAQVAPREVAGDHYVDDAHMIGQRDGLEKVGVWQGLEGSWSSKREGGKERLVLTRGTTAAMPALVLDVDAAGGALRLTNPAYAGTQDGKTDALRRVDGDDCRLVRVEKTADEKEADAIEQEVFGLGLSVHAPIPTVETVVGEDGIANRCAEPTSESALRNVWKDPRSGAIRATRHTFRAPRDERTSETHAQAFVYDTAGKLRLRVTTVETEYLGSAVLTDVMRTTYRQERTYFDAEGREGRTFSQRDLEQALVVPGTERFVGRRFTTLHAPVAVNDLPLCVQQGASARVIAADPANPAASIAAPPICGR